MTYPTDLSTSLNCVTQELGAILLHSIISNLVTKHLLHMKKKNTIEEGYENNTTEFNNKVGKI